MGSSMEKDDSGVVRGRTVSAKVKRMNSSDTFLNLIAQLQRDATSAHELSRQTGLCIDSTREFLRKLKGRKMIYVADWEIILNGRVKRAMYRFGTGKDVPRPAKASKSVICRKYRETQKARQAFDPFFAMCR